MTTKQEAIGAAFFEDAPCEITYHDLAGRWTRRTIHIEELRRDHVLARCEMRDGTYRRFNLNCISSAAPIAPSMK